MEKHQFKTTIKAPCEQVWNILWGKESYPLWTAPFCEGSDAVTDWKKGSKVLFVDGKGEGMVAVVEDNRPNEFMSFRHLGMVNNGKEDTASEMVKEWAGALEEYTLKPVDGGTELIINIDLAESMKAYMVETWPKALDKVKELSEQG